MIKNSDILKVGFNIFGSILYGLTATKSVKKPCGDCLKKKRIKYSNLKNRRR